MIKKMYRDWAAGIPIEDLTFKTVLTYENFKETNVRNTVQRILNDRFKKLSKMNFERVLRILYNKEIVNAKSLPEEIKFIDGRSTSLYKMPTKVDKANEYEEFSGEEEKEFMDQYENERALRRENNPNKNYDEESVEMIEEWMNDTISVVSSSDFLTERIVNIIQQTLPKNNATTNEELPISIKSEKDMTQMVGNVDREDEDSLSSDEPELIEDENLGLVPADYYEMNSESSHRSLIKLSDLLSEPEVSQSTLANQSNSAISAIIDGHYGKNELFCVCQNLH